MPSLIPLSFGDVVAIALAMGAVQVIWSYRHRGFRPFPPGPPGKPLIGNVLDFEPSSAWLTFTEWKKTYGPLVGLNVLRTKIVVLNSEKAINDLLNERGNIYSDRPELVVAGELMRLDQSTGLQPYGEEWRACRKLEHMALNPVAAKQYRPMQEKCAAMLVQEIIDDPANFYDLVRLSASRIVLSLTYGISARIIDDEYVHFAEETMDLITKSTVPGAFLADLLPFLKYSPKWVPFQRFADHGRKMIEKMVTTPYERVKAELAAGRAGPSLTRELLTTLSPEELTRQVEDRIMWSTGSMYGAGGETTAGTVLAFMIAMAENPEIQTKARNEIDALVGSDRLPKVTDRASLPYVDAVVKEVLRWHPMLPLSIARRTTQDDVYEGYFIPKGTLIMPNSWQIAFEPNEKYPPEQFLPERFLDPSHPTTDPATWAFGFGRRICPGKHVGEANVFITIATLLATLNFAPPPPSEGPIVRESDSNMVLVPKRFKCVISPRADPKVELARHVAEM